MGVWGWWDQRLMVVWGGAVKEVALKGWKGSRGGGSLGMVGQGVVGI